MSNDIAVLFIAGPLAVLGIIAINSVLKTVPSADPALRDTDGDGISDAQEMQNAQNDYQFEILTEATEGLTLKHFNFKRNESGTTTVGLSVDETAKEDWTHAKKELRLVKRNVTAARKDIHEQLQEMKREYRNERANMAPTLRGVGGKYGRWIRAAQYLNRYAQRRGHVNSLGTYEVARELCDEVLESLDKLRNIADSKLLELA